MFDPFALEAALAEREGFYEGGEPDPISEAPDLESAPPVVSGAAAEAMRTWGLDVPGEPAGSAPWRSVGLALGDGNREGWRRYVEDSLVTAGWWGTSEWWTDTLRMDGRIRVYRVGRRGAKSSTLMRTVVADTLASPRPTEGDYGIYAILSATREQAQDRLATCAAILEVIGWEASARKTHKHGAENVYDRTASEIELPHGCGIRVYTASRKGVVAGTVIGALLDEVALWADARGANPATEIFAALMPSMKTIKDAQCHITSAPWSTRDPHAAFFHIASEKGLPWLAAHAPTWIGNPSITEADCQAEAISEIEFQRAFAAIPIDTDTDYIFPPNIVHRAIRAHAGRILARAAGADWAFRRNSSAMGIAFMRDQLMIGELPRSRKPIYEAGAIELAILHEWRPQALMPLVPSVVFAAAGDMMRAADTEHVTADTHYAESAREGLGGNIALHDAPAKPSETYLEVRRLFNEDRIVLCDYPRFTSQIVETKAIQEMGGHVRIELPEFSDGSHGDLVSAGVLALWAASRMTHGANRALGGRVHRGGRANHGFAGLR